MGQDTEEVYVRDIADRHIRATKGQKAVFNYRKMFEDWRTFEVQKRKHLLVGS